MILICKVCNLKINLSSDLHYDSCPECKSFGSISIFDEKSLNQKPTVIEPVIEEKKVTQNDFNDKIISDNQEEDQETIKNKPGRKKKD